MILLYDLLIPGKLGCNVTKREGGGLALIQIFLFDAFPVMPVEGQWDGARL